MSGGEIAAAVYWLLQALVGFLALGVGIWKGGLQRKTRFLVGAAGVILIVFAALKLLDFALDFTLVKLLEFLGFH